MKGVYQGDLTVEVAKQLFDCMVERSSLPDHIVLVMREYLPLEKITSVSPNATAFPSRGPQSNISLHVIWTEENTPEKTDLARETVRTLADIVIRAEKDSVASGNTAYANYGQLIQLSDCIDLKIVVFFSEGDEQVSLDRVRRQFGGNYARLQQIKKKYDPQMLFSRWFAIEPAN